METNWFAIQARSSREKLAAGSLVNLAAEVFLPMTRQERPVCGVERWVTRCLFPGYLFARFVPGECFDKVRYARGVLRVVSSRGEPIPIDAEIVESLQERVQEDGYFKLVRSRFHPGDRVVIEDGALAGWLGQVEREWDDGRRVMILLDAIQQARVLVSQHAIAPEWAF